MVKPISRKRAMTLQALGGYINTGIQIIQGLLLVPMYLHFIGPQLYGLWLASGGILGMIGLMNLGFSNLLVQRVAQAYGQSNLSKTGEYFINGLVVYLILAAAFVATGFFLSFNLSFLLKEIGADESLLRSCFQIAVLATGLGFVNECLRSFSSALLRPLYSAFALASARIIGLAATIFLLHGEFGLWAIPLGMLVTEVTVFLLNLVQTISIFRGLGAQWTLNQAQIREYFRIGSLLFASRLGHALSREADPLLITLFLQAEVTAVYMVTRRAADIVFQLLAVIYASAHGVFSHLAGADNDAKTGVVAAQLLALVFFAGLVGFTSYVALDTSFITLWVGKTFALENELILLIGLAYFLQSVRNMILQILNGIGEFSMSSQVILLEGSVKTCLAAWLLNWIGIFGVPLALAVACLSTLFILGAKLKRRILLPITLHAYLKSVLTAGVMFGLAYALPSFVVAKSWGNFALLAAACVMVTGSISAQLNWSMLKEQLNAKSV